MHGLGNDFVVIDCRDESLSINQDNVRSMSDRRLGIGCDQILLLVKPVKQEAAAGYKIINRDGSLAEQCGNGLRCVVHYLKMKDEIKINTIVEVDDRLVQACVCEDGQIAVQMPTPDFSLEAMSLSVQTQGKYYNQELTGKDIQFGAVSMGNPHAVIKTLSVDDAQVSKIGAALQSSGIFLNGVNVGFMEIVSESSINLRVYERGAGETQACGTGACAAAVVGIFWGDLAPGKINVNLPGGFLNIEWDGTPTSDVLMTGPAQFVFEGVIDL
jgi:diaminopimelate epimerase